MSKLSKLKIQKLNEAQQIQKLENQLRQSKKRFKNTKKIFEQVLNGELREKDLEIGSGAWSLAVTLRTLNYGQRQTYVPYFKGIFRLFPQSKLGVLDYVSIQMILKIINYRKDWQRDLQGWFPKSRKANKMVFELIHHLFALYPVPLFMNKAWSGLDDAKIRWFIHIGKGGNLRTAPELSVDLTKKMAHYCLQGPSYLSIPQAIRRGQILALGGKKKLVREILNSRIGKNIGHESFWPTLIHFLIKHQHEEDLPVYEIVEYVHLQKFGLPEEEAYDNIELQAENPNFQLKGRNIASLIKIIQERFQYKKILKIFFQTPTVRPLIWQDQEEDPHEIVRIEPILNNFDLITEGQKMKHCVASYLGSCLEGNTSIWSMTKQHKGSSPKRLLTIELVIDSKRVYQARGKCNRDPKSDEMRFINQWVEENQLILDL